MTANARAARGLPSTGKAVRVHEFGPPDVLTLEDVPISLPGAGEVLVQVQAAGVGPWDGWIRAGKSALPQPLPLIIGSDLAGVVAAVGPGVGGFEPGDEVFGVTNARFTGAYSEYALADAGMIARKPASLTFVQAASVPVVAVTAWQALFDEARLERGARVLVHGAAGNVGAYALQFARMEGLHVIATTTGRNAPLARSLGADVVIDVETERFEEKAGIVDAVIDLVGGETQNRSLAVLRPGGVLVSAVSAPDKQAAEARGVSAHFFLVEVTRDRLERIAALIDEGRLRTNVGAVLPLSAAQQAHEMLESAHRPPGKIVLQVG